MRLQGQHQLKNLMRQEQEWRPEGRRQQHQRHLLLLEQRVDQR